MRISQLPFGVIIATTLVLVVVAFVVIQIYSRFLTTSVAGGVVNGKFTPCSAKPNCVSSMSEVGSEKYIEPIILNAVLNSETNETNWQNFLENISKKPRVKLVKQDGNYAHFVFTSLIMGYPDDVELLLVNKKDGKGVIEVRSVSRVGYSDLGVNRQRVEMLRDMMASL